MLSRTLLSVAARRSSPALLRTSVASRGHCQVPCGIFDDPAKVAEMQQDAATIRKAQVQIAELAGGDGAGLNQAMRWINTKEEHASKIIGTVSEYMLAQRVKPELFDSDGDYADALKAHHAVMTAAVKTKQVLDAGAADALDHALSDLAGMYTK